MKEAPTDPISIALHEDIGAGDITTDFFVPEGLRAFGRIIARERAIVAGGQTAAEVFRRLDPKLNVDVLQPDGTALTGGETILEVRGAARSILTAERVALNFLQRLSGIATLTRAICRRHWQITRQDFGHPQNDAWFADAGKSGGHGGWWREPPLYFERHGPGEGQSPEHGRRFFRIRQCGKHLRQERPDVQIEVEADHLDQVRSFLEIEGINVILLDNMKPSEMREAVALGRDKVKFEASGGVTLKSVRQIAATGVDYISVGALTHAARAIDMSLDLTHVGG